MYALAQPAENGEGRRQDAAWLDVHVAWHDVHAYTPTPSRRKRMNVYIHTHAHPARMQHACMHAETVTKQTFAFMIRYNHMCIHMPYAYRDI